MRRLVCAVVVVAGGLYLGTAVGAAAPPSFQSASRPGSNPRATGLDASVFPEPAVLRPAVHFWEDVFGTYSNHQSVLHSSTYPDRVIRVLSFSADISRSDRRRRENEAVKHGEHRLKTIVAAGADAAKLQGATLHLYQVLGGGDTAEFKALEGTLRTQHGQHDRTRKALSIAGGYWPKMKSIFASYGLPVALTRLPLVESSFNLSAHSKVGASGIWQFMPGAARAYMTLNAIQDDRDDPWTSTDAAARMLRDNYAALGSWPLAVTAYNSGRGGLQRALDAAGGSTLADLIKHCDNPRFGFASSNFYAEFLAANAVANHAQHYFGAITPAKPISFATVTTKNYVPYATLQRISGAGTVKFRELNPSFTTAVLKGHMYVPPDTTVRVPSGHKAQFQQLYAALGPGQRFSRQRRWYVAYRVRRGDALSLIAARHHVSVGRLMRVNKLRSASHIRIGQVLRIPTGGSGGGQLLAAANHPSRARIIHHRVRHGETLSSIGRRYHVGVSALVKANHLRDASHIRVGQSLSIPTTQGRGAHLIAAVAHPQRARTTHHRVRHGETLSGIAREYHVSVRALMHANHLHSAGHIRSGQRLTIPGAARPATLTHRVRRGQTLSGIAAHNNSSVATLRRVNNLRDADDLQVGMLLTIPTAR